ncbi:hypothetical protein CRE_03388 [Caenorhabditis remanei]|uniref:Uncharacterized protein n=1 Tax=Caenorhabditis remanei TaxID=31234 RepID=E3N661_CAERE|nr:hypothetical protein CRE_03388 [Caenorhabditis remanei]
MSFHINRSPFLVQIEVLKQLEINEIFLMTLCSRKMKKLVQSIRLRPKKIRYSLYDNETQVSVGFTESDENLHHMAKVKHVSHIPVDEMTSQELGGERIECRCSKNSSTEIFTFTLEHLEENDKNVLALLQNHCAYMFSNKPRIQLEIYSVATLMLSGIINHVKDTSFICEKLNTSDIRRYLRMHSNHESVQVRSRCHGRVFTRKSKLLKMEGLSILRTGAMTPTIMHNFSGRFLLLQNSVLCYQQWSEVIRKWKNKEAYHKLHALIANNPEPLPNVLNWIPLLREFNALQWDGSRRPQYFKLDPKTIHFPQCDPEDIDCTDWLDIEQDGGNKWASIQMTAAQIRFFVWN